MAKQVTKIILLTFLLSPLLSVISEATLLENIPLDSWVYEVTDELHCRGLFSSLHKSVRPYRRGEIASLVLEVNLKLKEGGLRLSDSQLWLLAKLNQEFRLELEELYHEKHKLKRDKNILRYATNPVIHASLAEGDSSYGRVQARFEASLQFDQKFVLKDRVVIDTEAEKEKRYVGREWKHGLTGVFDQAYANIDLGYLHLLLGRDHLRWGPGREDVLLLSGRIPPFDMIKIQGNLGSFKLIFFAAKLDRFWVPGYGFRSKRYLSGHRINLKLKFGLEMGISEVVLYGGEDRDPEAYYLNPLLPFYGEQHNRSSDDNILWSFDIALSSFKNKEVYFELLVDDFQYDFESEPHQTGFQLGLKCVNPFGVKRSYLNVEYTKINNWVYGQNKPWNVYTYHGRGIGSALGPDADRWHLRLLYHFTKDVDLSLSGEYRRKGEGRIDIPQSPAVPPSDKFPSGIVEYTSQHQLILTYQPGARLKLDLFVEHLKIKNLENESGRNLSDLAFRVRAALNLWKEIRF
ncbi:MAG: capsule assembly Wzi family protein [Candidatus Zixiibacteriota bacterium]